MSMLDFKKLSKEALVLKVIFGQHSAFDISKVRTKEERSYSSQSPGIVSLDDCFSNFSTEELLKDENQVYCRKCKEHRDCYKKMDIY